MATHNELFVETFEIMQPGDCLMIAGGTFPGLNETAEAELDLRNIYPFMNVFYCGLGSRERMDKYPIRSNPIESAEDKILVPIERNSKRFGFDPGDEWFRFGKGAGVIGGKVIDFVTLGAGLDPDFYFVSKPQ